MAGKTGAKPKPKLWDWAKLKGRTPWGRIVQINSNKWTRVEWHPMYVGPILVHLDELEVTDERS